jgi:flagellar biosynthesis activator protein FlaF
MSNAAQAYARVSTVTATPRENEMKALLKAASKFQIIMDNEDAERSDFLDALMFNRQLWTLLLSAVTDNNNKHSIEVRQNVANIGIFVMKRTMELQLKPEREKLKALIDINCSLAAGISAPAQP